MVVLHLFVIIARRVQHRPSGNFMLNRQLSQGLNKISGKLTVPRVHAPCTRKLVVLHLFVIIARRVQHRPSGNFMLNRQVSGTCGGFEMYKLSQGLNKISGKLTVPRVHAPCTGAGCVHLFVIIARRVQHRPVGCVGLLVFGVVLGCCGRKLVVLHLFVIIARRVQHRPSGNFMLNRQVSGTCGGFEMYKLSQGLNKISGKLTVPRVHAPCTRKLVVLHLFVIIARRVQHRPSGNFMLNRQVSGTCGGFEMYKVCFHGYLRMLTSLAKV
ncbi:hypothetical protein J6590_026502 [Homalodisca vitripennis]|nr:hypothetical protein J6590_026502 [Homalodisca vitripennis]